MYKNGERMMAWVDTILTIKPHNNADTLELAMVKGWQVVVKKGAFQPGDKVIYISIDSWVPTEIAPFLSKGKEPRVYKGVRGERLRTVKLRQEISQGIILPLSVLEKFGKIVTIGENRLGFLINKKEPLNCEDTLNANLSNYQ